MTVLKLLPETVNVCEALAVFAQAVKDNGPPTVLIIGQEETVTALDDVLIHFPLSVCVAVSTLPAEISATGMVQVVPDQLTAPALIELPLLNTTILEPFTPVPLTVEEPAQMGPVIVGVAEIAMTTMVPVAVTVPQPPVSSML